MGMANGVWHRAGVSYPKSGDQVLCVKQLKNGEKTICFGTWHEDLGRWVTTGGNSNVILWMPLPRIPEEAGRDV